MQIGNHSILFHLYQKVLHLYHLLKLLEAFKNRSNKNEIEERYEELHILFFILSIHYNIIFHLNALHLLDDNYVLQICPQVSYIQQQLLIAPVDLLLKN